MLQNNRYIISLGGSLIVPDQIDTAFLKSFKQVIDANVKRGKKFLIITGGGKTARRYAEAARQMHALNPTDLDWLGIHATRLNAHLLRTIFRQVAHPKIVTNPHKREPAAEPIIIAAGWRPGSSTDHQAVLLSRKYNATTILNLTDIDYVYDKDPHKFKNAKPLKNISWKDFKKIIGDKWNPGANTPFDPVASRKAEKLGLKVVILNGKPISNLEKFLANQSFKGTIIK
ncbi:MAG TPA: UMP kinase [Patescibacteria group bacterium]|jgi:uridylate kinase|nr:UMP kinase [Patescibacteria group bacterium]